MKNDKGYCLQAESPVQLPKPYCNSRKTVARLASVQDRSKQVGWTHKYLRFDEVSSKFMKISMPDFPIFVATNRLAVDSSRIRM